MLSLSLSLFYSFNFLCWHDFFVTVGDGVGMVDSGQCILWPINNHFKIKIKNIKKLQSILLSIVQYIKVEIAFTIFKKSNITEC